MILLLYIDDMLIVGQNRRKINSLKKVLLAILDMAYPQSFRVRLKKTMVQRMKGASWLPYN